MSEMSEMSEMSKKTGANVNDMGIFITTPICVDCLPKKSNGLVVYQGSSLCERCFVLKKVASSLA